MHYATRLDVARAIERTCPVGRPLRVVAGGNDRPPCGLLHQLSECHRAESVELFMLNAPTGIPAQDRIRPVTPFAGVGMRDSPRLRYLPARLVHVPRQLKVAFVPDLVLLAVAPPWQGRLSMGPEVNVLPAAVELLSEGTLALHHAGALDRSRPVVASFAMGGPDLCAWVHRNPAVRFARTETVNDPNRIAQNPGMCSINSALTVDLYDQANASHIGSRLYSGLAASATSSPVPCRPREGRRCWRSDRGTPRPMPQQSCRCSRDR